MEKRVLCALGDSITVGIGVPEDGRKWTELTADAFLNLHIVNLGVGGQTSQAGRTRIDEVLSCRPAVITLQYGMNDHCLDEKGRARVSETEFKDNMDAMKAAFRRAGDVILITNHQIIEGDDERYYFSRHPRQAYRGYGGANKLIGRYNDIIRAIAADRSCGLIDMEAVSARYDPFHFLRSLINSNHDDGVHPHTLGAAVYAHAVTEILGDRHPELIPR